MLSCQLGHHVVGPARSHSGDWFAGTFIAVDLASSRTHEIPDRSACVALASLFGMTVGRCARRSF
jgi:hypothetical protein